MASSMNLGTQSQVNRNPFNTFGGRTSGVNLGTQSQVNRNPFNTFGGATSGSSGGSAAKRAVGGVNLGTKSQVNHNPFNTFGGATHGGARPSAPKAVGGVNLGTKSQVNHNPFNTFGGRTHGGAGGGVTTPVSIRPKAQKVTMGATRNRPTAAVGGTPVSIRPRVKPAGSGTGGALDGALRGSGLADDVAKVAPIKKSFMNGRGLAIGAGAAVIAGLAMNRRGDGTSSGRSSMTKY